MFRKGRPTLRSALLAATLVSAFLTAGCAGGAFLPGERLVSVTGSYGSPTTSAGLWPAAQGQAENVAVAAEYGHFVRDRLEVAAAAALRRYDQAGQGVTAAEIQFGARYHFVSFALGTIPAGFYGEVFAGIQSGSRAVPERGSKTNFTQDTGFGFELRVAPRARWITGYRFKHLSNGEIFGDENPSQNDHQLYTGIAFRID